MKLLEFVTKEFISIVENLADIEPVENGRIIIEKEHFRKLLEKYNYMPFRNKANVYKSLNFIIHDKNNYTLPVKDHTLKRTVRKVVINYNAYETMKYLYENDID